MSYVLPAALTCIICFEIICIKILQNAHLFIPEVVEVTMEQTLSIKAKTAVPPSVTIHADIREKPSLVTKILQKKCDLQFQSLVSADYRLSARLGVERKTTSDFLQSMIDKRLFNQLHELKRNFAKPLLLIEGNGADLFSLRKINENAIRGALASVVIDYSVPIIWTHSPHETASMLYSM